jgi:hypothetical protein
MASSNPADSDDWTDPGENSYDHYEREFDTYANTHKSSLTRTEAEAVQMLYEDGWTAAELRLAFNAAEDAVYRAIRTGEP